jgi:flagellar basal body-associated protein FliL
MKKKSTLPFIIAVPLLGILLVAGVAIAMRMGEKEGMRISEKEGYVKEESVTKGTGSFASDSGDQV